MKRSSLLRILLILPYFVLSSCNNDQNNEELKGEDVVHLEANDPMIEKFKQQAQDEMDYLIDFMAESGQDTLYDYMIKAPFAQGEDVEHMWVETRLYEDGSFYGTLINEPYVVTNIQFGDSVKIKREDVEDWILNDYLMMARVGGFSSEYLEEQNK